MAHQGYFLSPWSCRSEEVPDEWRRANVATIFNMVFSSTLASKFGHCGLVDALPDEQKVSGLWD